MRLKIEYESSTCYFTVDRLLATGVDRFDPKLNRDHLQQCLLKLLTLYTNQAGDFPPSMAEFESYYLLTNLGKQINYLATLMHFRDKSLASQVHIKMWMCSGHTKSITDVYMILLFLRILGAHHTCLGTQ